MIKRLISPGFTLLELLVAMALFAILSVALFTILSEVNRTWQTAQARMEPRQSGRTILEYLSRDLKSAALPANRSMTYDRPASAPRSPDLNLQFVVNPPQISASKFLNPHALFWQAPISTSLRGGNLAEVGYFVRWDLSNPQNPRAALCRFLVNPDAPDYLIYSNSATWTPSDWLSDSLLDATAPGFKDANNPANSYKGWFADNVIAIWSRCLDPEGNVITNSALNTGLTNYAYDSRKGYRYVATAGSTSTQVIKSGFTSAGSTNQILATLPASVEIALVILDSPAAARLTQKPTYPATTPVTQASFWQDIDTFLSSLPEPVRRGARVYSNRIVLENAD